MADLHQEFFTSVSNGNVAKVSTILNQHPDALDWRYTLNGLNQPVTMIAHDLPMLKFLLEKGADPNAADRTGNTRLIECGDGGDAARLLLEHGADIDKPNERGLTPLMRAAFNSCTTVVKVLIDGGANPDLSNVEGKTAEAIARERFFPDLADVIHAYAEEKNRKGIALMRPLRLQMKS
jgi:ankyrin repeat protein